MPQSGRDNFRLRSLRRSKMHVHFLSQADLRLASGRVQGSLYGLFDFCVKFAICF